MRVTERVSLWQTAVRVICQEAEQPIDSIVLARVIVNSWGYR